MLFRGDEELLKEKLSEYLENDEFNLISVISKGLVNEHIVADILVPDEYVVKMIKNSNKLNMKEYPIINPLGTALEVMGSKQARTYVIVENQYDIELMDEYVKRFAPRLELEYRIIDQMDSASDSVLNDINSITPDAVIAYLEGEKAYEWFSNNKMMMNVKLGVCISKSASGDSLRPKLKKSILQKIKEMFSN